MRACMYVCLYVTGQECMEACRHAGWKGRATERPSRRAARAARPKGVARVGQGCSGAVAAVLHVVV